MNKKKVSIAGALLFLAVGATWALGYLSGGDPQVAELEKLRDENFSKMGEMTDEQRRAQFEGFRDKVRELSDDQRRQFFESSLPMMQQMMNQRMDEFFAKSPADQRRELDERIDQMEQWRASRDGNQEGNRENRAGDGGRGGGGWGNMTPQQRDQRRKGMLDHTTPEMRGKMDRYRDMMNERRKERGLDPISGGGGFPRMGGPR